MKKFIISLYSFVCFLTIGCIALTSCGGDDDDFIPSGTENPNQSIGGSTSDNKKLEVIAVYSHVGSNEADVKEYMSKNYNSYELDFDLPPGWTTDGAASTMISYTNSSQTIYIQYPFYEGKLLFGSVTYQWYDEGDFNELLGKLSDMYNVSIEKTGESTPLTGGKYISYGGGINEGGKGLAVYVSCAYGNHGEEHMFYQVTSN